MAKPRAIMSGPSHTESIDVREIDNGYIVRRYGCDSKGNYKSCETYSQTKPEVLIALAKAKPRAATTKNALLSAATSHLKRK